MNTCKKLLCFTLVMFAAFALYGQVGEFVPVTIITQEDADNVDVSLFVNNPDFTPEENKRLIRAVLDIALFTRGFDIGYDIWTLVDEAAAVDYFNERRAEVFERHGWDDPWPNLQNFLGAVRHRRASQDRALWITPEFMLTANREGDRLFLQVRTRSWPRDNPNLDVGGWILLRFANVGGQYKLIYISFDA